jgi:hypothetical protein
LHKYFEEHTTQAKSASPAQLREWENNYVIYNQGLTPENILTCLQESSGQIEDLIIGYYIKFTNFDFFEHLPNLKYLMATDFTLSEPNLRHSDSISACIIAAAKWCRRIEVVEMTHGALPVLAISVLPQFTRWVNCPKIGSEQFSNLACNTYT